MFHVRRLLLSLVLYAAMVGALVYAVVELQRLLFPAFFPLSWNFADPASELPLDLLILHFVLPYTISYFNPRDASKAIMTEWTTAVARALCISDYLLGGDHPDERGGATYELDVAASDSYRPEGSPGRSDDDPATSQVVRIVVPSGFPWRVRDASRPDSPQTAQAPC